MTKQNINIKIVNIDAYKIEEINVIVEQNYYVVDKKEVAIGEHETSFRLGEGKYYIYALFSSQGLSYITPKILTQIPDMKEVTINIAEGEIDDVLVDPA